MIICKIRKIKVKQTCDLAFAFICIHPLFSLFFLFMDGYPGWMDTLDGWQIYHLVLLTVEHKLLNVISLWFL